MKKRLQLFIESSGMSTRRFEIACGFPNAYVSNIKHTITPKRLAAIAEHFPQLNISWLLSGEGEMLRQTEVQEAKGSAPVQAARPEENRPQEEAPRSAVSAGNAPAGEVTLERAIGIIDRMSQINLKYSETSFGQGRVVQQQNDIIMHLNRLIDRVATDAKENQNDMSGRIDRMMSTVERSHDFAMAVMKELLYTWSRLAQQGVDVASEQRSIGSVCLLSQRQVDEFVQQ